MPTLKDIMTRTVISVREADSLLDAQQLMVRNNIERLVVIDDRNIPIGIITQRDMIKGLMNSGTGKSLDKIGVKSVMTKNPISLDSQESMKKASQIMTSKNISSIIAVDKMGRTVGIVTKSDVCRYLSTLDESDIPVKRFMSKNPITIGPNYSIFAAANVMSERSFTRLIVIEDKKPVGIVTLSDLVPVGAALTSPDKRLTIIMKGELIPSRMFSIMMVRNIMTSDPFTINENADIVDAA
ncbi:MAG TPA: CBS domain-containing protein, partial [Nitrososphaerales archaeon]